MKRILICVGILIVICSSTMSAYSTLIDNGNGTITQIRNDGSVLMWLQDANYAKTSGYVSEAIYAHEGRMFWSTAMKWADDLEYAGYRDWRLPRADPLCNTYFNCENSELGNLFYQELGGVAGQSILSSSDPDLALFVNIQDYHYWTSTDYPGSDDKHWAYYFYMANGGQSGSRTGDVPGHASEFYAWAVRVVPEPISSVLFMTGTATFIGRHYIKRKKKL